MKKANKILAVFAVLVLALTIMAVPAFAATTINGTDDIEFDKYLTMDKNVNVPDATFSFTISPGSPVEAVTTTPVAPAVIAGPDGAKLSYGTSNAATVVVDFKPGDTTYNTVQSGDTVVLAENKIYAKETVTVDLTDVTFEQAGVFRYNITETATNDGITNDVVTTRYLDIYIDSDENGDLSIAGSIMHNATTVMGVTGGEYSAKDGGFTNNYTTYDLSFSKEVTGNQGFRSKYFTFTVAITGADANTKYAAILTNASPDDGDGNANPSTLTADGTGAVTGTFYLKDGETITICGLTAATQYTISEDAEDYTASYKLDNAAVAADGNSTPANAAMGESSHSVVFTNDRSGVVPTGILLEIAPYALVVLLACASAALMMSKKRKSTTY